MNAPAHRLVLTTPEGRTFALDSIWEGGVYVLVDLDEGKSVGEVGGDFEMHLIDGEQQIIFAGVQERDSHAFTVIEHDADERTYPVKDGVWMAPPETFTPGMQVTAIWQSSDRRELFRIVSHPLYANTLRPLSGPQWTHYAPLDE